VINKVNLFVVGAMKAGTTTFVDLLAEHNDIYVPPVKEPNFFVNELPDSLYEPSRFFHLENYLENVFPQPLHNTHIKTERQYKKIFSKAGTEKYRVDSSVTYLHAPGAAERIHQYNPDATIIILLRNPFDRAYSHFTMNIGLGKENRSFDTAINEEIAQYENGSLQWSSYLGMSLYDSAIDSYKKRFQKVSIIKFEELVSQPKTELQRLADILGIDSFKTIKLQHKNKTRRLLFPKLLYFMKQLGIKDLFSKVFGSNFKQKLFRILSTDRLTSAKLSMKTKEKLNLIFNSESPGW
jgi:Sulfotransferase family